MTQGVVFEGGGLNGAASSRRFRALAAGGLKPTVWAGDSIGAVLAYLTALLGPEAADALWDTIKPQDIYRGGGWLNVVLVALGKRPGVYDMRPARATLSRIVAGHHLPEGVTVIVRTVDLKWGCVREHLLTSQTEPESCCELAYQSCLVPVAMGARDGRWADGGIAGAAPISSVVRAGADKIDVLLLNPLGTSGPWVGKGALQEGYRAVDVLREELIADQIEETQARNLYPRPGDSTRQILFHEPVDPLPDWMDASPAALAARRATRWQIFNLAAAVDVQRTRRGASLNASVTGG